MLPSATLTIVVSRKVRKSTARTVHNAVDLDTDRVALTVIATRSVWQRSEGRAA